MILLGIYLLAVAVFHMDLSMNGAYTVYIGNVISYFIIYIVIFVISELIFLVFNLRSRIKHLMLFSILLIPFSSIVYLFNGGGFGTVRVAGRYVVQNERITPFGIEFAAKDFAASLVTALVFFALAKIYEYANSARK